MKPVKAPKLDVYAMGDDVDAAPEVDTEESSGGDDLLGNAFDALEDGDKPGFIRSMKAFLGSR